MDRIFKLAGEGFDLDILTDYFRSSRTTVEKIEDQYFLRIAGESWTGDDDIDWNVAEDELSQINGIAKLLQPNFRPATISGIATKNPVTGEMNSTLRVRCVAEIRSKASVKVRLLKDGIEVPQDTTTEAEKILSLCDKYEHLARTLLTYGALPHEWRELSMVVDAIEDHHGSKRELEKKDYYPPKLDDFKATANSFKALKLAARHGWTEQKGGGVEEPTITLNDAKEVIHQLLEDTIKSLKTQA